LTRAVSCREHGSFRRDRRALFERARRGSELADLLRDCGVSDMHSLCGPAET
jgi:hypothetical protein